MQTVNGVELYFERHGDGPPLLNISGSGGDLRRSLPERSPLNKSFDVLHYDQRGLGQATKTGGPFTMADYADDAAAMIEQAGWEQAHIVGTSFGGMVALELAVRHPERIDRMVLNCTSPGGLLPSFPLEQLEKMDIEAAIEMRLGLLDNRWDPGKDQPIPGLGSFYDILIERYRKGREPADQAGYLLHLEARAGHDVMSRLKSISTPTLVCAGEYDDQAPLANSMAIVEGIDGAELRVFQGGHLFLTQDRSSFPAIITWLTT